MNKITVYGIPNCDITRKVLNWYSQSNIPVDFHDYKIAGIAREKLAYWCQKVGWQTLLNKKSTTWRSLSPDVQQAVTNEEAAIQIMMMYTSIIKRPVVEINNNVIVGFKDSLFSPIKSEKKS